MALHRYVRTWSIDRQAIHANHGVSRLVSQPLHAASSDERPATRRELMRRVLASRRREHVGETRPARSNPFEDSATLSISVRFSTFEAQSPGRMQSISISTCMCIYIYTYIYMVPHPPRYPGCVLFRSDALSLMFVVFLGRCVSGKANFRLLWLPMLLSSAFTVFLFPKSFSKIIERAGNLGKTNNFRDLFVGNHGNCWFYEHFQ